MKGIKVILVFLMIACLTACGNISTTDTSDDAAATTSEIISEDNEGDRTIEELKEIYPEFFDLEGEAMKGIEVYVWQMSENSYRCGLMFGTNRNKTDEEIQDLHTKSLSIDEAKMIFQTNHISEDSIIVCPVRMAASSYYYEIDEKYSENVKALFGENCSISAT